MSILAKLAAEFLGTACLVFVGCGAAILSCTLTPPLGIGYIGVGLAFGLTVLCMAYTIGHISGCHLNPAVSLGLCAAGRFPAKDLPGYIVAQLFGAIAGAVALYMILRGQGSNFSVGDFASNGYLSNSIDGAAKSAAGFTMWYCFFAEMLFTAIFLFVITGSTSQLAPKGMAPIAIGLCLTMIHLALIPITNCSLNPARSTATALIVAGFSKAKDHNWAVGQLWLFWLAPIIGGILGGLAYRFIEAESVREPTVKAAKVEKDFVDPNEPERFDVGGKAPSPKPVENKPH